MSVVIAGGSGHDRAPPRDGAAGRRLGRRRADPRPTTRRPAPAARGPTRRLGPGWPDPGPGDRPGWSRRRRQPCRRVDRDAAVDAGAQAGDPRQPARGDERARRGDGQPAGRPAAEGPRECLGHGPLHRARRRAGRRGDRAGDRLPRRRLRALGGRGRDCRAARRARRHRPPGIRSRRGCDRPEAHVAAVPAVPGRSDRLRPSVVQLGPRRRPGRHLPARAHGSIAGRPNQRLRAGAVSPGRVRDRPRSGTPPARRGCRFRPGRSGSPCEARPRSSSARAASSRPARSRSASSSAIRPSTGRSRMSSADADRPGRDRSDGAPSSRWRWFAGFVVGATGAIVLVAGVPGAAAWALLAAALLASTRSPARAGRPADRVRPDRPPAAGTSRVGLPAGRLRRPGSDRLDRTRDRLPGGRFGQRPSRSSSGPARPEPRRGRPSGRDRRPRAVRIIRPCPSSAAGSTPRARMPGRTSSR